MMRLKRLALKRHSSCSPPQPLSYNRLEFNKLGIFAAALTTPSPNKTARCFDSGPHNTQIQKRSGTVAKKRSETNAGAYRKRRIRNGRGLPAMLEQSKLLHVSSESRTGHGHYRLFLVF